MSVWAKSEGSRQGRAKSRRLDVEIRLVGAELSRAADVCLTGRKLCGPAGGPRAGHHPFLAPVSFHH